MMSVRSLLVCGVVLLGFAGSAAAQDASKWAVGTWVGDIRNQSKGSKSGPTRTLEIKGIRADGTLDAGWSASGRPRIGNVTGKLSGDTITLTTSEDAVVELIKGNDGALNGSYRLSGKPYPITLTKQ